MTFGKYVVFILLGTVLVSTAALLQGCGGAHGNVSSKASDISMARFVVEMPLDTTELSKLPTDFEGKAKTAGWIRTSTGYCKSVLFPPGTKLTDGIAEYKVGDQGQVSIPSTRAISSLKASVGDVNYALARKETITDIGTVTEWQLHMPFKESCCVAENKTREAMDGRCLDYNGWWSDGVNYPRSDWRAWRNFIMSDCDRALGSFVNCWLDHSRGGCWAVHGEGGCSRCIGHAWTYHKHNFPH